MMNFLYQLAEVGRITVGAGDDQNKVDLPKLSADSALHTILTTVYTVAGIICVLVIIAAGFMYVTSAGNAAAVKKAKDAIFGAVIGIIIIMLAFAITAFITGRIG